MTLNVPAEPGAPPVEFRLAPGRMLRGRVVDPQGKPIAGANLIIPDAHGKHKGIFLRKWTDAQGRFEWDSAPEEPVGYSIGAEGYAWADPISLTAGEKEAIVVLKPEVVVRLRAVDAETDKPVPRFDYQIGTSRPGTTEFAWEGRTRHEEAEGAVRVSLKPERGPYQIPVFADGYKPARTRIIRGEERIVREVLKLEKSSK